MEKEVYTGEPVKAPQYLAWMRKLPDKSLSLLGMKKSIDGSQLYMSPLINYIFNQNPAFYNMGRMLPAEPSEKTKYSTLSIALGLKFWLYDEDKQKEYYFRNFKNEADRILRESRTLGNNLPSINDVARAYKYAYDLELRNKYNISDIERFENTMDLMSTMGIGMPSKIRQPLEYMYQTKYIEPYRAEYKESTGIPFGELYNLMGSKGIKLSPKDIQSILNMIGQTTQLQ